MSKPKQSNHPDHNIETELVHLGRDPSSYYGFVNTPVFRGSTVLYPTYDIYASKGQEYTYGRRGTPTVRALEETITRLEGGALSVLTPSGLNAVTCAYLSVVEAGDHILVSDSVYQPARRLCDGLLKRLGVETTFYDPLIGGGIAKLMRDNTRLVYTESPGSQTFEIQDLPAIAQAAHAGGAIVLNDNTWGTPLYHNPLKLGADMVIHAGTKYFGGHADVNLGSVTANEKCADTLKSVHGDMGVCASAEDVFLSLRGIRTLSLRLRQHQESALEMARWLKKRFEVTRVMHPALEDDPGHALWKRDFNGSSGLFSIILKPVSKTALGALLDGLELFGMGASWGSFESLVIPFNPAAYRTATKWEEKGQALRFYIGLENLDDLKADLEAGFDRMNSSA